MAKPFESSIQNLVYNVDVGIGLRLIKSGLYILIVFIVMLVYTATQFRGLRDAEAMDCAQIGRNLVLRHGFITQCIRPATIWCLSEKSPRRSAMMNQHPDILHPPLWPTVLAAGFAALGSSLTADAGQGAFAPEQYAIIPTCHVFSLLTGLLVFLLGRRLFDRKLALLAATVYFSSDLVWGNSISGLSLPLVTFLCTAAFYAAHTAVTNDEDGLELRRRVVPIAACAVLCILAFLTRYAAAVLVPAFAVYFGLSLRRRSWHWAAGFVLVFLIGISPWLARNKIVSGGMLGLAPYTALNTSDTPDESTFERRLAPVLTVGGVVAQLQAKGLSGFARIYNQQVRNLGDGILVCLFITAFLFRFVRPPVHRLRWAAGLAMALLILVASLFGDATARLLQMFWPLVILYGLAFFYILLDRLQLRLRLFNLATVLAIWLLCALPMILTMLPPRAGVPYPPYFPPFITHVCKMLEPDELLCTDMPWATAWYGNRSSLLLPSTIDEFYEINDYHKRISGLYMTTITRDKPYVRNLLTGPERSWFPLLEGRMPGDFPLTQGFPINNMDQIFLTDRVRWKEQ